MTEWYKTLDAFLKSNTEKPFELEVNPGVSDVCIYRKSELVGRNPIGSSPYDALQEFAKRIEPSYKPAPTQAPRESALKFLRDKMRQHSVRIIGGRTVTIKLEDKEGFMGTEAYDLVSAINQFEKKFSTRN